MDSNNLYKFENNYGCSLKIKDLVENHGNEEELNGSITSDCTTCLTNGLRIVESVDFFLGGQVFKPLLSLRSCKLEELLLLSTLTAYMRKKRDRENCRYSLLLLMGL